MNAASISLAAIVGSLVWATFAHAQPTGSHIGPSPAQIPHSGNLSKADRARVAMYNYAECVVERSSARVEAYLGTFPGSKEAYRFADRLATDECLSTGEISFKEALFRGGVYNVLYRMRFRQTGPVDFSTTPAIDYSVGMGAESYANPSTAIALRRLADCTIRQAPEAARALVLTRVASKAEDSAFEGVVPHMSSCLSKETTLRFSKSVFRGVIGEALYRLSVSANPTASDKD